MKHLRRTALVAAFVLAAVIIYGRVSVGAWGNEGHTMVNRVAALKVPVAVPGKKLAADAPTMPAFLRDNAARIAYLGPEPDRWRSQTEAALKWSQEADHFLDYERIPADFGPLPNDRYLFMKKLFERRAALLAAGTDPKKADELLPQKVGLQPYITMEIYGRLKVAFREHRRLTLELAKLKPNAKERKDVLAQIAAADQNAVFYAGWLGHYVADVANPLHCTVNYDGWTDGPNPNGYRTEKGVHYEFEALYVRNNITDKDFAGQVGAPVQLKDPFNDYMAYFKTSFAMVPKVYELDKAGAFKNATPEAKEFTAQRLGAASQMLLNLWYTAWMESAVPLPERGAPAS